MAISRTGYTATALYTASTSLSVTPTMTATSGTFPMTAGDILLASVTAAASTSVQAIRCTTAGWVACGQAQQAYPGPAAVAYFWKRAVGSDAAPTFVSTASGSNYHISALIEEFTGADQAMPVIAAGYAGGTSGNITPTTQQSLPMAGGYAVSTQVTYNSSSTTNAFTAGANFTTTTSDGATAFYHYAREYDASPPSGSTLAAAGTWGSATTFRAAMVVVIQPPISAIGVYEDPSAPPPIKTTTNASSSVTASFSPPANSLVVVMVNILYNSSPGAATITVKDSIPNTYTTGPDSGADATCSTQSAIFTYRYATAPGSITITVTNSNTAAGSVHVAVKVLLGADPSQTGAASSGVQAAASTAQSQAVTTTRPGSYVYLASGIGNRQEGETALAANVDFDQYNDTTSGHFGLTGRSVAATGSPGSVTLGWTQTSSSAFTWAGLEILPAPAPRRARRFAYAPHGHVSATFRGHHERLQRAASRDFGTVRTGCRLAGRSHDQDGATGRDAIDDRHPHTRLGRVVRRRVRHSGAGDLLAR